MCTFTCNVFGPLKRTTENSGFFENEYNSPFFGYSNNSMNTAMTFVIKALQLSGTSLVSNVYFNKRENLLSRVLGDCRTNSFHRQQREDNTRGFVFLKSMLPVLAKFVGAKEQLDDSDPTSLPDLKRRFELSASTFAMIEASHQAQRSRESLSDDAMAHVMKFRVFMETTFKYFERRIADAEAALLKFYYMNQARMPPSETEQTVRLAAFRAACSPSKKHGEDFNATPLTHEGCVQTEIDRLQTLLKQTRVTAKYSTNTYGTFRNVNSRVLAIGTSPGSTQPSRAGGQGNDDRNGGRGGGRRSQGQGARQRQRANARSEIAANPRVSEEGLNPLN